MARWADHPAAAWVLGLVAFALAAAGALPWAGGYNDGSRLATSESLIERATLAIDDSVFVRPPPELIARGHLPYAAYLPNTNVHGTLDKVFVKGRYYSDKPAVPAVLTAGAYRVLMVFGLPRPSERPDVFCRVAAILTCGLGYAVAVGCMWTLARRAGLGSWWRLVWLLGFALAGVLPAYTRQLNAGVPQLVAVAGFAVLSLRAAELTGPARFLTLLGAGTCVGFGYAVEGGSGPPLLACALGAVAVRLRSARAAGAFLLGAAPWVVAHHGITYAVGGVWVPLGMVPEYLEWPGSPFDRSNMTGVARHTPLGLLAYTCSLMLAWNGFLVCNPPLLLAAACGWLALLRPWPGRVELAALLVWCVAVWGVYALLSDNAGGGCLSVRWFVPMLVPGYWALARLMAERPTFRADFVVLLLAGLVLGCITWPLGPWLSGPISYMRPIVVTALTACLALWGLRFARRFRRPAVSLC